jgi:dTDP-4-dehydrorhamnose reductase
MPARNLRILMFGRTGQVAQEMLARAPAEGTELVALSRADCDLSRPDQIEAALAAYEGADLILNAAAYTAVDQAEAEEDLAFAVNGIAPGVMARACAARGLPLVHLSTDYVFSGDKAGAWTEDDPTDPQTAYGRSKLAGERAVTDSGARALILRTSWVFSPFGRNFVKTMLRLGRQQDRLGVVDDQTGRPTAAGDVASFLLAAAPRLAKDGAVAGLYHFAGAEAVTWRGFAQTIMEQSGLNTPVDPIATADFPTPAKRPTNSVLDTSRLERVFGLSPRPWRAGLDETLARLQE